MSTAKIIIFFLWKLYNILMGNKCQIFMLLILNHYMGKNKSNMSFLIDNYCMEDALPISMKSCENQIKKFNS